MDFLEKEIRRIERCKSLAGLEELEEKKPEGWRGGYRSRVPGSASALYNGSSNGRRCDFCNKDNHVNAQWYGTMEKCLLLVSVCLLPEKDIVADTAKEGRQIL